MFLVVELLFLRKLSNFERSGPVELLLAVIYVRFGKTRVFFPVFPIGPVREYLEPISFLK